MRREELVKDLLPHNALVLLVGPPKCGKSTLAAAIATAVATGRPFAGHETNRGPILWITYEEAKFPGRVPKGANIKFAKDLPPLDLEATKQILIEEVRRTRPKLVIVDSLYGAFHNNLSRRNNALRQLTDLKNACPCTVLVVHLTLKRDPAPSESRQTMLAADAILALTRVRSRIATAAEGTPPCAQFLLRLSGPTVSNQTIVLQSPGRGCYRQPRITRTGPKGSARHKILCHLRLKPMATKELQAALALNPFTLRNVLNQLSSRGEIHRSRFKKWTLKSIPTNPKVPS